MSETTAKDILVREWSRLGEGDRRRVIEYARSLSGRTRAGVTGASLLALAGTLADSDASEMAAAIEEGCEKVDPGAW
jgi:hypothetical protein